MSQYYTDREYGVRPRTVDVIDERVWGGLYTIVQRNVSNGAFGYRFPEYCSDTGNENAPCGCNGDAFQRMLSAEVPFVSWPLAVNAPPDTPVILDLLEFCAGAVGQPITTYYHSFMRHNHLRWDRDAGLATFVGEVNLLFSRNGVAFELSADGTAQRLLPAHIAEAVGWSLFSTEDAETNRLLEAARTMIASPKPEHRQDALENLWDAFERMKTLEPGANKGIQTTALLDRVAVPGSKFRQQLEDESRKLTDIGNTFRIRHSETTQEPLSGPDTVDYLFGRMFMFVRMVLRATGRGG